MLHTSESSTLPDTARLLASITSVKALQNIRIWAEEGRANGIVLAMAMFPPLVQLQQRATIDESDVGDRR